MLTALKVINFARALARAQILSRISASYSGDQELSCGMRIVAQLQKMWKRALCFLSASEVDHFNW